MFTRESIMDEMNIPLRFVIPNGMILVPPSIPRMDIGMEVDDHQDSAFGLQRGFSLNEFISALAFVASRKTRVTVMAPETFITRQFVTARMIPINCLLLLYYLKIREFSTGRVAYHIGLILYYQPM